MLYQLTLPQLEPRPAQLADGLALHLQHAPLTSLMLHRRGEQQVFLALPGCPACASERCTLTCPAELLRCTLRAAWGPTVRLHLVQQGLLPIAYTRVVLAWPTATAQPLQRAMLSPYDEARLVWHGRRGRAGALLAVGSAGPDPAGTLRARGWQTLTIHPRAVSWARTYWAGRSVHPLPTRPTRMPATLFTNEVEHVYAASRVHMQDNEGGNR